MQRIVLLFMLILSQAAQAHGPTPQKMEEKVSINASIDQVWEIIGDFQSIASWHPLVDESKGEGNAVSAERTLTLKGKEGSITDSLDEYEAAEHYLAYRLLQENINVIPASFYTMRIELSDAADGNTEVIWSARFYRADTGNFPKPEFSDEAAVAALKDFARQGLDSVKATVEQK